MSYAYFQGQETEALVYYKKLLETERNPDARKELEELVAKLQRTLQEEGKQPISMNDAVHNAALA